LSQVVAYRFGPCFVDLLRRVVVIDSDERRVGSKIFDLLVALIDNRHRMVSRDELARVGWRNGFVSDAALSRAITRCRKAIEDDRAAQPLIRAQWGKGYRFSGDVEVIYAYPLTGASPMEIVCADTGLSQLARLPVVHIETGLVDARTAALGMHLDLLLSRDASRGLCPSDRVSELLQQLESRDPLVMLRHLWCQLGSVTVLAVEMIGNAFRWSARVRLYGPDGSIIQGPDAEGADAASLAQNLFAGMQRCLPARGHSQAPVDLPDAFTVEAYLRAAGAADQWRWHQARRLAMVVCDQAPESLSAQMLLLRTLLHTHTQAAVDMGERLLVHIGNRVAPEYQASVHVALGQSLSLYTDAPSHERALAHLQSAVDLTQGKPAAVWGVRAHLALAATHTLGDSAGRQQAAKLLDRAATIADACGNGLLASAARSNLGYLLHHDGHIERSLRLHEAVLQEVLARRLDGPATFALSIKGELVRAWGQLTTAQGWLDLAWESLGKVAADDRAQPAAYLAYVQTALSLDRGCVDSLQEAVSRAPRLEDCHPRHRVHLAIALARAAFVRNRWCECQEWLTRAVEIARAHGLPQMVCPPMVMSVQLGMAMNDRRAVEQGLEGLEALSDSQQRVATEAEAARARAWLACQDGDLHRASRLLVPQAVSAHEAYYVYLARMDAAWIALRLGSIERADELLQGTVHWASESAVGQLTAMALVLAQGCPVQARECLVRARNAWQGAWPCGWSTPEAVVCDLDHRAPSHALLGLLVQSHDSLSLTAGRAA
jgi:DNA-binding winged helix-turn-helix (wHTH) protein/tetratricopeptide (TPR) repeat protein